MKEKKIEDFGEKIEGARKDLAAIRSGVTKLTDDILDGWTDVEREQYITKDLVWKKPDYQKMLDEGMNKQVVYYIKLIRDALPTRPVRKDETYQRGYVNFVSQVKDWAMALERPSEFAHFKDDMMENFLVKSGFHTYSAKEDTYGCFQTKLLKAITKTPSDIQREMDKKQFLFTPDEKALQKHISFVASPQNYHHTTVIQTSFKGEAHMRMALYRDNQAFQAFTVKIPEENQAHPIDFIRFFDKNSADYEEDKFFIVGRNGEMLYHGIDTEEEARKIALEYARKAENIADKTTDKKSERTTNGRKAKLLPPQLEHIQRTGEEHREKGIDITGEDILDSFKLRGGQFGNWTNQNDRQTSMNMCFDAFRDLAVALDIAYEDVALKRSNSERTNTLAIAFGARGHSSALAHYEPIENVINLTKMNGAGSLAHEWGHALDSYIKSECGLEPHLTAQKAQKFMASHCYSKNDANPFDSVVSAMTMKEDEDGNRVSTDYYKESKKTDGDYAKTDNGYWRSNCEMFARAFACYVHDKLKEKGIRSDYLCGHSECTVIPRGEERQAINAAIDNFIDDLKERGLLHHQEHDIEAEAKKSPSFQHSEPDTPYDPNAFGEQMSLFDLTDDENDLPSKKDVESEPKAAAAPLPPSNDTFDLTQMNFGVMVDKATFDDKGEPTIRFTTIGIINGYINDRQMNNLLQRAGISGDENIEKALELDKKFHIDIEENGHTEGVLQLSKGFIKAGEFSVELSNEEIQLVTAKAEAELNKPLSEEMEIINRYAFVDNDKNDRDIID